MVEQTFGGLDDKGDEPEEVSLKILNTNFYTLV